MRRSPRDERGAVALFTAVVMVVLILIAAMAVDLGMQRVVRRDMQSLADTVAFDLARQVDGRTAAEILASPEWTEAKTQSVGRNGGSTLGGTPDVEAELGVVDASYVFSAASGATVPTAVRVTAGASVGFAFTSGSGSATRSAVAVTRAQACYKLGSWAARLSTESGANIVYQALQAHGIGAGVSAATYQSLAGAHVDVASLSTALGLASPEDLATTSVSLSTLLDAAANVAGTNGSSGVQISALHAVTANLGALGTNPISLGGLFDVAAGAGTGLVASVNLADLVIGSVLIADGNKAVSVPDLTAGVPGLASVSNSLTLVQAARSACGFAGSTPNSSNQVTLESSAKLAGGLELATSLLDGIESLASIEVTSPATKPVTLSVSTAMATSTLESVTCRSARRSVTVAITGGLLSATLTVPVSVKLNFLLGLVSVTVEGTITAELTPTGTVSAVTIEVPPGEYDRPYSNGGSPAQLPAASVGAPQVSIGSLPLGKATAVLDAVAATIVVPMLSAVNSSVLGPLSDLVGLRTPAAYVLLLDHPTCSSPALRG